MPRPPSSKSFRVFKLSSPNGKREWKIEGRPTGKRERYYFVTEKEAKNAARNLNAGRLPHAPQEIATGFRECRSGGEDYPLAAKRITALLLLPRGGAPGIRMDGHPGRSFRGHAKKALLGSSNQSGGGALLGDIPFPFLKRGYRWAVIYAPAYSNC
jgi:hypothetical protein